MLSRVAENIYWLARYLERAENTARLLAANATLHLDLPRGITPAWEPLIAMAGARERFERQHPDYSENEVVKFMIGCEKNPSSILSSLRAARENGRTIRDYLPREAWELINKHHLDAGEQLDEGLSKRGRHEYLKRIILTSQTLNGLLAGTMNHDQGYHFLLLGRNIERADMTTRIIDVRTDSLLPLESSELPPFETIQWVSLLRSLSAYQMYRRSMQARVRRGDVLIFLFQSQDFPRSIRHNLCNIERSLKTLPKHEPAVRILYEIKTKILSTQVEKMKCAPLHNFIDQVQIALDQVHGEIRNAWFLPAG
ncbi:alpha-E domain-containing protein [Methylomicrobium sp. Wu6]|uniref:alpha-E domain-containing protein n=1 Tax=Methylomicrobium sp. Wu6 TaxID=3107928 RepID=UPI002DD6822A|nr:alpha-E domain-containing protein [Methylomicrobium sp. Wu6]MEC4748184.1 alpha-E domain-containing protein [Methylomicrobium sp. Wu6]